ncbi:hypothetical protein I6A84_36215 [Frankia sp. CNm7]|uniref:Uncharacterized protein n=1 Tax=Frankia nepalensis TaxID=1836974 RepID=A0A937RJH1_9ACTN|nr:hypothetical protein [Frankia nepalensis]MBL7501734.1 hypothetical protein [Frankia nepalensis]MBL7514352.1 hypothetical protein [Frankia nepalensis]MBL7523359.1 hypothetical protein [Frankia nepalensis]MBL7631377.1 hypothetical protein [Frankia nepalensis]
MTAWIDLDALWKIVVIGLLCGAGLPAVFAVGLRVLSRSERRAEAVAMASVPGLDGAMTGAAPASATRTRAETALAGLCFAVILAAIAWGVAFIVAGG